MPVIPSATADVLIDTSGKELITEALELLGVLAEDEDPTPSQLKSAKRTLNYTLDSLNSEKAAVHAMTSVTKVLTAADGSYTLGAGGDIDTPRPPKLEQGQAYLKDGDSEYELDVLTTQEWAGIPDKTVEGFPAALYYAPSLDLGNVNLFPVPQSAYTLVLWLPVLLTHVAEVTEQIYLAPAYAQHLSNILAVALAPKFGKSAPPEVLALANLGKANFKRMNSRTPKLCSDVPGGQRGDFDIRLGY